MAVTNQAEFDATVAKAEEAKKLSIQYYDAFKQNAKNVNAQVDTLVNRLTAVKNDTTLSETESLQQQIEIRKNIVEIRSSGVADSKTYFSQTSEIPSSIADSIKNTYLKNMAENIKLQESAIAQNEKNITTLEAKLNKSTETQAKKDEEAAKAKAAAETPKAGTPAKEESTTNDENAATTETAPPTQTITVGDSGSEVDYIIPKPNPLSEFASSTYNISLYMINPDTFNEYSKGGAAIPKDWKLICRSGGINNSRSGKDGPVRAPGFDLDFYIDGLRIMTAISSKETLSACNSFDFSFQIYEPYGFTFPTKLVEAATKVQASSKVKRSIGETITALQTHYMLVIRFYGYDKNGNVITSSKFPQAGKKVTDTSAVFERSFPIQIYAFDFKLDPKMVVYNVKAKLVNEQIGLGKSKLEIPEDMTISGETVQDVLQGSTGNTKNKNAVGLVERLNQIQEQLYKDGQLLVKDKYSIKFEDEENSPIAKAFLVDVDTNPIEKTPTANVKTADAVNVKAESKPAVLQKRTRPISINGGSSILQAIDQIISQSSYVTRAMKIKDSEEISKVKSSDEIYSKNTPATIAWYNVVPDVTLLEFDKKRNVFATDITYIIKKYEVPYIRGLQLGKRTPYYGPVKRYKHWYMSNDLKDNLHQKEIISYDITYNLLYFNLAGYGNDAPLDETNDGAPVANLSGGSNPTGKEAGFLDKTIGPVKTFLYSPADQLKAKIVIMGDPDYLMTATSKGYQEAITKWFGTDQSINPNSGQVFIEIDFRDAEDYVVGYGNGLDAGVNLNKLGGLLNPSPDGKILFFKYPDSMKKKVQGVVYMVWQVVSTFNKGLFQQELKVCIPNFVSDSKDDTKSSQATSEDGREQVANNNKGTVDEFANITETGNDNSFNNTIIAGDNSVKLPTATTNDGTTLTFGRVTLPGEGASAVNLPTATTNDGTILTFGRTTLPGAFGVVDDDQNISVASNIEYNDERA